MASVKLAPILQDLIGSINGDTFSHVRSGLICKAKSEPGSQHPFSPTQKQLDKRTLWQNGAINWKNLSQSQISDWNALAQTINLTNKFNETFHPSGFNVYCWFMYNIQLIDGIVYDDCPLSLVINPFVRLQASAVSGSPCSISLTFFPDPSPVDNYHLFFATPALSVGRNYAKNEYRLLGYIPNGCTSPYDISIYYNSYFPPFTSNQRIFFKVISVYVDTGYSSPPIYANCVTT
jgi:hypothetical protein